MRWFSSGKHQPGPREDRPMADEPSLALEELLRKAQVSDDVDFLREGVRILAQALMEVEVTQHVSARRYERTASAPVRPTRCLLSHVQRQNGVGYFPPGFHTRWFCRCTLHPSAHSLPYRFGTSSDHRYNRHYARHTRQRPPRRCARWRPSGPTCRPHPAPPARPPPSPSSRRAVEPSARTTGSPTRRKFAGSQP